MKHHPLRDIMEGYAMVLGAIGIAFRTPRVKALMMLTTFVAVTFALVMAMVEGWGIVDSFYFAVVSMATVGYGDLAPETAIGKLLTIGFLLIGIGLFVLTVGAIADAVLSALRKMTHRDEDAPGDGPQA